MTWVRIDDGLAFHRKVLKAGNEAMGAWLRMCAQSSREELDGFVPIQTALAIALRNEVLDDLCAAQLLEPATDGFLIHDYLDYNPSARELRKLRKERVEAGRVGGTRRAANAKHTTKQVLGASLPVASTTLKQNSTPSRPDPVPIPDRESAPAREEVSQPSQAPIQIPQPISPSSELSTEMHEYAAMQGLADIKICWEKFLGLSAERGKRTSDLFGSWKRFVADEVRYQRRDRDRAAERGAPAEPKKQAARQIFRGHQ